MVSSRTTGFAAVAAFATVAFADYSIEPSSVPLSLRQAWCQDEKRTCPIICQQSEPRTTLVNECDPEALTYGCLCGNNQQPNVSEYSLTLPYYICQEWGNQCVKKCGQDNTCSSNCRENNPCGAQNPSRPNSTSTTSADTPDETDDSNTIYTGSPGDSNNGKSGSGHKSAGFAVEVGRSYGLAIVIGGLFGGFAML